MIGSSFFQMAGFAIVPRTSVSVEDEASEGRRRDEEAQPLHKDGQGCLQGLPTSARAALLLQVLQEGLHPVEARRQHRNQRADQTHDFPSLKTYKQSGVEFGHNLHFGNRRSQERPPISCAPS